MPADQPDSRRTSAAAVAPDRRDLAFEILLVLGVSLGKYAVYALVDFVAAVTAATPLSQQTVTLNEPLSPRPLLDLTLQVLRIGFALVPVALVAYFLHRSGTGFRQIGVDRREPARDAVRGAVLALVIGGCGIAWYLGMHAAGVNLTVAAQGLPESWWRIPLLVLAALENAILEEVVLAFVLVRLRQIGWSWTSSIALAAVLRGAYHLYQGIGGFTGNIVMGLVFGWLFRRWGRAMPFIIAHTLIDIGAFVGYAWLQGRVAWLP